MKKNLTISLTVGIILSAAALYLAFRNVPILELIDYLASINYLWVIPATFLIIFSFVVRVVRWQIILASSQRVSFWRAFHPLMIGFMINCILPGRLGEVARPMILSKRDNFPVSTGLATVAAERVFDIALLIILFAVVLATVKIRPDLTMTFGKYELNRQTLETIGIGMLQICLVLLAGIVLVTIEKTRSIINRLIHRIPHVLFFIGSAGKETFKEKICIPLVHIVDNFAQGLSMTKDPGKILTCFVLSVVIWGTAALSYYVMSFGSPGIELTFLEMTAVLVIICFFIALPSVPGFWGVWEAGGVFAMSIFDVAVKDAAGFTLASHAIQMIPVILVGFGSAVVTGIKIRNIADNGEAGYNTIN